MAQTTQFIVRIDKKLKMEAQKKAQDKLGIGLGTLTKLFLKSFTAKSEIVFYLGDKEFDEKLNELLKSENVKTALKKLGNSV
jgi:antitoxin component of RelBE/YafQ-DinJ toxin-antitoxin module